MTNEVKPQIFFENFSIKEIDKKRLFIFCHF